MKKIKWKTFWLTLILFIVLIFILAFLWLTYRDDNGFWVSGLNNFVNSEYKVNINIDDCLDKDQISKLMDLGSFKDNEMLVYRNGDSENPIEVWKIKLESGDDQKEIINLMQQRRENILESFNSDLDMKEKLSRQEQNVLNCGGRHNDNDSVNSFRRC